jgi:DNA-binding SARP family transcriptional activator
VEFRILGPLEVPVAVGPAKQRALLGALLLRANEIVATEQLVDDLWGETPPASAPKLVQAYVSQLRRALGTEIVITRAPGYVATIEPDELDAVRFSRLVADADALAQAGKLDRALAVYDEALALWRGRVLADVTLESRARDDAELLEELRLGALARRIDCALALGRAAELVPELEALVAQQPFHEGLRAQLMLALYRCGRQADALAAYRDARRALVDELGIEPGPELRRLEQAILAHDPSLRALPRARRRRPLAASLALLLAGGAVAAAALALSAGGAPRALAHVPPNSIAVIDPEHDQLVAAVPLHTRPSGVAFAAGALWVTTADDRTLVEIDPKSHAVIRSLGLVVPPVHLTAGGGSVWIADRYGRRVEQVQASTGIVVRVVRLRLRAQVGRFRGAVLDWPIAVAASPGALWLGRDLGVLTRVDARTGRERQLAVDSAGGVAYDGRSLWSAGGFLYERPEVRRLDPRSGRVLARAQLPDLGAGRGADALAADANAVWGASETAEAVWRLASNADVVTSVLQLRHAPAYIARGGDAVWTANDDATVSRIDPATGNLVATIALGRSPRVAYPVGLAVGAGRIWVPVR